MADAPPALSASGVTKRYGDVRALDGVTLAVAAGECVALVGESGSGKTTLLRCFNRLVEPEAGSVRVRDRDIHEHDAVALRRQTGYVPQEGGLLPHWTVLRNVELVPWLGRSPDARALAFEALSLVGLGAEAFATRYPHELSGGQRQRVAMARALAARQEIVLLDEPFGALDAITRADLQMMFLHVRRSRPLACLLVTHDLHEAMRLADLVAVMRAGRIEQVAGATELLQNPGTPYVERLLARAGVRQ